MWQRKSIRNNHDVNFCNIGAKWKEIFVIFFKQNKCRNGNFYSILLSLQLALDIALRSVYMKPSSVFFPCWPVLCLMGNLILFGASLCGEKSLEGCFLFILNYHHKVLKLTVSQYQIAHIFLITCIAIYINCVLV